VGFGTIGVSNEGPVATVTLRRPQALNAITVEMLEELIEAFTSLGADDSIRVIVLTGEGRAFSAGVDLKSLHGRELSGGAVGDLLDLPARRLIELITTIDALVIAAVKGFCFTGALEIALAVDIVVAAENAVFADTHAKFGLRPTWGMTQRLPRAVGAARARFLSYTSRRFSGREACDWGLAALSCPLDEVDTVVHDLAMSLVDNSPGSLAAYKDLYRLTASASLGDGLSYEANTTYAIADTEDRIREFR
jgi:enoyl-CoA hydratase